MQRSFGLLGFLGWCVLTAVGGPSRAQVVGPPDYIVGNIPLPGPAQGDVAVVGTSLFTGQGTFGAGTQTVIRRDWDGTITTVITGLNSIGGFAGDYAYLFVTDNGGELAGAITGDTVFALPNPLAASGPVSAAGLEVDAPGAIPFAQGITLGPPGGPFVGDAAGSGSGRAMRHRLFGFPPFVALPAPSSPAYDFVAGLAFGPDGKLYVGDVDSATFQGRIFRYDSGLHNPPTVWVSGLSGAYDQAFDHHGRLLVTGGFAGGSSTVVAVDAAANVTQFASGFSFSTGIDVDENSGRVYVVDFGSSNLTTFTPLDKLFSGGGKAATDCWSEFSDVTPVLRSSGKPTARSVCQDGAACDLDGSANGACTFALGICLRVPRSGCTPPALSSFEIVQPGAATLDPSLALLQTRAQAVLSGSTPVCVEPVAVQVPLTSTPTGFRAARKTLRVRTRGTGRTTDRDRLTLRCLP